MDRMSATRPSSAPAEASRTAARQTRLPGGIKSTFEARSGIALDDVRVHLNSDEPGRIGALAFTRGTRIHVAPGQQEQLAHEAWHVVQQKQGRVRPTTRIGDEDANDSPLLEREADSVASSRVKRMEGNATGSPVAGGAAGGRRLQRSTAGRRQAAAPPAHGVIQLRIAGLDHIVKVGDIPANWVEAFLADVLDPTSHLFDEDIVTYLEEWQENWDNGVSIENRKKHWDVTFATEVGDPIQVQTRQDGSCGVHVIHAVQHREEINESVVGYFAPEDFVTEVRQAIRQRLQDRHDEIRVRILKAIEESPNRFESGLGPQLQALIGIHEQAALAPEAEVAQSPQLGGGGHPAADNSSRSRNLRSESSGTGDATAQGERSTVTDVDPDLWLDKALGDFEALSTIDQITLRRLTILRIKDQKEYAKGSQLITFCKELGRRLTAAKHDLEEFINTNNYVTTMSLEEHALFRHPSISLYPKQKTKEQMPKGSARKVAHRPILDVEFVGDRFFARCYLGLYGKATQPGQKDIIADDSGEIELKDIGLMNLGNPFKALLWCEDYLKSREHQGAAAPKPVIRSFLVPLAEATWMLDDSNSEARPLDQDRGAGQFGHPGQESYYAKRLNPVAGSLVSFFLDVKEYQEESKKMGQTVLPMPVLQHYLTGQVGDPRDMAIGVAAQHQRKGYRTPFNPGYVDPLTAYYDSVDPSQTGFSDATQGEPQIQVGKFAKQRAEIEQLDLSKFPSVARAASGDRK
jgi:hypothetical protein